MADRWAKAFESPNGPGDARPTALQVIQDENLVGKWTEKVVLITGCSSGIGIEFAKAFFQTGAALYLTVRDVAKGKAALGNLLESDRVHLLELDLESLESVRECAKEFLSKSNKLNVLIANAGIMAVPEGRTKDGFEKQFGVNHLAHFLLFNQLKPTLLASSTPEFQSRVVLLASLGHRFGQIQFDNINLDGIYEPWAAYGQSKTANIWTANEIERRYGSKGLHAWSVQPGAVDSGLTRHLPKEVTDTFFTDKVLAKRYMTPEQGAATGTWGATAKVFEGRGGKYLEDCQITPPWDPESSNWHPGYATWAYDAEGEGKLWKKSLELLGLPDDD